MLLSLEKVFYFLFGGYMTDKFNSRFEEARTFVEHLYYECFPGEKIAFADDFMEDGVLVISGVSSYKEYLRNERKAKTTTCKNFDGESIELSIYDDELYVKNLEINSTGVLRKVADGWSRGCNNCGACAAPEVANPVIACAYAMEFLTYQDDYYLCEDCAEDEIINRS